MSFKCPEHHRIKLPGYPMGDETCGAFIVQAARDGHELRIIASASLGWEHVSVSRADRCPTWDENNGRFALDYCDGPRKKWIDVPESTDDYMGEGVFEHYWIQCSDELSKKGILPDSDGQYHWEPGKSPLRWRPSIHMPRWASRITLEVTGVRVERLQDISENDAIAEGVDGEKEAAERGATWYDRPRRAYRFLWQSINGPGTWDKNPWVWVVEFKRVDA